MTLLKSLAGNKKSKKVSLTNNNKRRSRSVRTPRSSKIRSINKSKSKNQKRILIVDDNEGNRMILSKYLEYTKTEHDFACNGKEMINMVLDNGEYDIIYCDFQMPIMDGYKAVKILRDNNYHGPIIGVTGYVDNLSIEKARTSGVTEIIEKPLNRKKLINITNKYNKLSDSL